MIHTVYYKFVFKNISLEFKKTTHRPDTLKELLESIGAKVIAILPGTF